MNPFHSFRPPGHAAILSLLALFLSGTLPSSAAAPNPAGSDYTSLTLVRGKQNQLLLKLPVNDKSPLFVLDTGSPVTCVDDSKSKLFKLAPAEGNGSSQATVMVNGMQHNLALIPSLVFGPVEVQNLPVVLVDLSPLNKMLKSRRDFPNDAILGLDTMRILGAVIDCGTGKLLLPKSEQSSKRLVARLKEGGWTEIPMHVDQGHLVVRGSANRYSLDFIVDTGSPVSVLDRAFCTKHKITLNDESFSLKAIHFETGGAKVGRVADMKIGRLDIDRTLVAVFNVTALLRGRDGDTPQGLLGSRTLQRTSAFIDCENSRLYMKVPKPTAAWGF